MKRGIAAFLMILVLLMTDRPLALANKTGEPGEALAGKEALPVEEAVSASADADSVEPEIHHCGDYDYLILEDGTAEITRYTRYSGYEENLTIPAQLDNIPVTSIGDYVFKYCNELISVTIPDSVTSIGIETFLLCEYLTSITIPNNVTSIGDYAFSDCYELISVTIPDSVTSIAEHAFSGCVSLTSIAIPDSVTSIGDGAFYWCTGLTSITIPDSVTSIGDYAFQGCVALQLIVGRNTYAEEYCKVNNLDYFYSD